MKIISEDIWYKVQSCLSRLESLRQSTPLEASSIWDDKYYELYASLEELATFVYTEDV